MRTLPLLALAAATNFLPAQSCGVLAIAGSGAAGSQLQFAVSGAAPGDLAVLLVAESAGATSVPLPMGGSLVLGLEAPFLPVPIGRVDAAGAAMLSVDVPAMLGVTIQLQGQAALVGYSRMPFALRACASNVVPFAIG